MADYNRKRKFDGPEGRPAKHVHRDNSYPRTQKPSQPGHGLPPVPDINEKYRSVVFTHPTQSNSDHLASYDRLEFLGDAYLELYATQLIFDKFSEHEVGKMSQIRETLVRNETIGQYASLYGFDKQLKNYKQFQNGSAQVWLKIKGDIFEAYVAAVVLSSPDGSEVARRWLHQLWDPKVHAAAATVPQHSKKSKEVLAKRILMKGSKINYVDEKAPIVHYGQGKEEYFIGVYFNGWGWENQFLGSGRGYSRVEAGQFAAENALQNHPLIDQIAAKKNEVLALREMEAAKEGPKDDREPDFIPLG
ncbi:hypothetical protein H2200_005657 [Cladophialophora chaetospira]|uniref:RNase III domain-containing protein n=1 Tax=Cladophialophora chaetospira TaxID=386627 RepID=A0AA38XCF0_9EURO|nr:hypothetical protein H2200_005657 [Cladophialophora chaetospira]